MMHNNRLAELISRKISGEATEEELQELEDHLQDHPQEQYFTALLLEYWQARQTPELPAPEAESNFHYILQAAGEEHGKVTGQEVKRAKIPRLYRVLAAAVIALLVVVSYWWLLTDRKTGSRYAAEQKNEAVAKRGSKLRLLLPDGTTVWLNSESRLLYKDNFKDSAREVTLEGEGFFNVVQDPSHPFTVHTSGMDINVLGTAFNVKSYPADSVIEATLLRGSIAVTRKDEPAGARVVLKPHEKLIFNKLSDLVQATTDTIAAGQLRQSKQQQVAIKKVPANIPDSSLMETSWVYNKLIFDGDNFKELAQKMERWFNVTIVFHTGQAAAYRFRGVFENENIGQALNALQLTAPFHYKINNNEVDIY